MSLDPILIVGAGLAGLSAAYHLRDRPYRLIEAEPTAGGLCRSIRERGFTFDHTGHLLHLRRPEIRELVFTLVGEDRFIRVDRRSSIYSHGVYTDYPFQVNTHGLPREVIRECVMGFADTLQREAQHREDPSFADWVIDTFGHGIAEHFLFPYNRKLFHTELDQLTADWVSWSIPKPSWGDVVRGALGTNRKAFGYNPQFLYPAEGGIDLLPRAFLSRLPPPEVGVRMVAFDAKHRTARLSTGERISWSSMVTTIPLPELLEAWEDPPSGLRSAAASLRHVSVLNLNLGFDGPSLRPDHWVYFPEPRFPFYRVGVYSNLCPASAPVGSSSYYVEISHLPEAKRDPTELIAACARTLSEVGLVSPSAELLCARVVEIPVGYVIHDRSRSQALPRIHAALAEHGVTSIGRYGAWEYAAMEDAIANGRDVAAQLLETDRRQES